MKKIKYSYLSEEYIEEMRKWLLKRLESKTEILKKGETIAIHSENDLKRIRFALKRIEEWNCYGICTNCGVIIEQERLEFMPETPLCAICAKEKFN